MSYSLCDLIESKSGWNFIKSNIHRKMQDLNQQTFAGDQEQPQTIETEPSEDNCCDISEFTGKLKYWPIKRKNYFQPINFHEKESDFKDSIYNLDISQFQALNPLDDDSILYKHESSEYIEPECSFTNQEERKEIFLSRKPKWF